MLIRFPMCYLDSRKRMASCLVSIVLYGKRTYVVFEQREEWEGPSITNSIEEAIMSYLRWADVLRLPRGDELVWVEHYSGRLAEWDQVTLHHERGGYRPEWKRLEPHVALSLTLQIEKGHEKWLIA